MTEQASGSACVHSRPSKSRDVKIASVLRYVNFFSSNAFAVTPTQLGQTIVMDCLCNPEVHTTAVELFSLVTTWHCTK